MRRSTNAFDRSKRVADVCVAAVALILLSPLLGILALTIRWRLGAPVLFTQQRPGHEGKLFTLIKFRTMLNPDPARGIVENKDRMTRFGSILRASSLDELPSLWNILRGNMSLVGPRPLLPEYLPLYTSDEARRHEVRPGLTGLAQVSGRNALKWEDRFRLDVFYVDNRSWKLDLRVIGMTIRKVIAREGISSEGHSVGAPFQRLSPSDTDGEGAA